MTRLLGSLAGCLFRRFTAFLFLGRRLSRRRRQTLLLGHQIVIALLDLRLERLGLPECRSSFLAKGADLGLLSAGLTQGDARLGEGLLGFGVLGLGL